MSEIQKYSLDSPDTVLELATELQSFVKGNGLTTPIQGKDYVNVEGWQYAGARLGLISVIDYCKCTHRDLDKKEYAYKAGVKIINLANQQQVGYGIAMCSNKEHKKRGFDEYAIESMAQTRAIGKAYRSIIGWLMKTANLESTPAEEMPQSLTEDLSNMQAEIAQKLRNCNTLDDLKLLNGSYPEIKIMRNILDMLAKRRKDLDPNQTA